MRAEMIAEIGGLGDSTTAMTGLYAFPGGLARRVIL